MRHTWLQREDPPWKPELFQFFLRTRLPWLATLSIAILVTVDTGEMLPWLLALLASVLLVNLATYRQAVVRTKVPAVMGLIDVVSPMLLTIWIPGLVYPALTISVMAAILARLAYGPRIAMAGVGIVVGWSVALAVVHPMPWLPISIMVYSATATRSVIGLGVLTRREIRIAERLRELVELDELTGLSNRASLIRQLGEHLDSMGDGDCLGLLYLDLDRFKEINDGLGHHHGDRLLVEVAKRLRSSVPGGVVARMGGDEFAVVVAVEDVDAAIAIGDQIAEQIAAPITLDDLPITTGASVGIALAPAHSREAAGLIKRADIAMYRAKAERGTVTLYEPGDATRSAMRLHAISGISEAASGNQLCLAYQPLVELETGRIRSFEALVRWDHPAHGILPPAAFIELAEMTGAISDISRWVLRRAMADCAQWRNAGHDIAVSINVSMIDLERGWLGSELDDLLDTHQLDPSAVTLELTETAAIRHLDRVANLLTSVADRGVRLSVDDFGAGHTSLTYLRELPVQQVKIDGAFTRRVGDTMSREIIVALVGLGERTGIDIVAEGLEVASTVQYATDLGCRLGQGFQLGRPAPVSALRFGAVESGRLAPVPNQLAELRVADTPRFW
ncbi:MAG: putative bifunctional diguanylate cyclase/phosphodiesterase [Acidimicrobiales bacterium]